MANNVLTHASFSCFDRASTSLFPASGLPSLIPKPSTSCGRKSMAVRAETKVKRLDRELGGQWLSSVTRHIRIYAGYIDPESCAMDQTQLHKLTLMLDPHDEFVWPQDKCQKVYDYFAELVDQYAGAPLEEYTLRLIGSDLEHFIRKMLLAGEIKYNLNSKVLNFSMGKPRLNLQEELEAA